MAQKYGYALSGRWHDARLLAEEGLLENLLEQGAMLISQNSLTSELEEFYGSKVVIELLRKEFSCLNPATAVFLDRDPGLETIEREAWLKSGDNKKLLYAHSILPISSIEKNLFNKLESEPNEPLGRVLKKNGVVCSKKKLELGLVSCPDMAGELALRPDTLFLARRYVLADHGGRMRAAVAEVFAPETFSPADKLVARLLE